MAKTQESSEKWDRVYEDVERARKEGGTLPDPKPYEDLTKSAGSRNR